MSEVGGTARVTTKAWPGLVWAWSVEIDERIEELRRHVVDLEGDWSSLAVHLRGEIADREEAVGKVDDRLTIELARLRR